MQPIANSASAKELGRVKIVSSDEQKNLRPSSFSEFQLHLAYCLHTPVSAFCRDSPQTHAVQLSHFAETRPSEDLDLSEAKRREALMSSHLALSQTKVMPTLKPEESVLLKGLENVSIESLAPFVPNAVVIYHSKKEGVLTDVSL